MRQSRRGMLELSVQYDEHAYLGGGYGIPKRSACQTKQAMKRGTCTRRTWNRRLNWRAERAIVLTSSVPLGPLFPVCLPATACQAAHSDLSYPDTTSRSRQTST
jgi:hypothetical protein